MIHVIATSIVIATQIVFTELAWRTQRAFQINLHVQMTSTVKIPKGIHFLLWEEEVEKDFMLVCCHYLLCIKDDVFGNTDGTAVAFNTCLAACNGLVFLLITKPGLGFQCIFAIHILSVWVVTSRKE